MLRIQLGYDGKYYIWHEEEPMEAGPILAWIGFVIVIGAFIAESILIHPQGFATMLVCTMTGLLIHMLFVGKGPLSCLESLALPFFTYGVMSGAYALNQNAEDGAFAPLVWLVSAALIIGMVYLLLMRIMASANESAYRWFILVSVSVTTTLLTWYFTIVDNQRIFLYIMQIVSALAAIMTVMDIILWWVQKKKDPKKVGNADWKLLGLQVALIAIGILPFLILLFLSDAIGGTNSLSEAILLLVVFFLILLAIKMCAEWVLWKICKQEVYGATGVMMLSYLLLGIGYFAIYMLPNIPAGPLEYSLDFLRWNPLTSIAHQLISKILVPFSVVLENLLLAILELTADVMGLGAIEERIHIPAAIMYFILAVLMVLILHLGTKIIKKSLRRMQSKAAA